MKYTVHDVLRMPDYPTVGGYRVWKVIATNVGGLGQEGTYHLEALDKQGGSEPIHIPIIMLDSHPAVSKV